MKYLLIVVSIVAVFTSAVLAEETVTFRDKFIYNYKGLLLMQQDALVKANKDLIPGEVRAIIDEAMAEEVEFYERMYLLDVASAMATMYKYHFDDRSLNKLVDPIIRGEVAGEKERAAKLMRWKLEEKLLGNFVLKGEAAKMEEAGQAPVLYPHWIHRLWYECKVCHEDVFTMKRWSNKMSHKEFRDGLFCGVCHDGERSFGADDYTRCKACHLAGTERARRLHDPSMVDFEYIEEVAERVGSQWDDEKLPEGKLIFDKYGFVDWLAMKRGGVFKPVDNLNGNGPEDGDNRSNLILFRAKSDFVKDTLFNHEVHSDWIKCTVCHPAIFKEALGGNEIKMRDMQEGRYCGRCHGKVAFTFADCTRCHRVEKGVIPDGALVRE